MSQSKSIGLAIIYFSIHAIVMTIITIITVTKTQYIYFGVKKKSWFAYTRVGRPRERNNRRLRFAYEQTYVAKPENTSHSQCTRQGSVCHLYNYDTRETTDINFRRQIIRFASVSIIIFKLYYADTVHSAYTTICTPR